MLELDEHAKDTIAIFLMWVYMITKILIFFAIGFAMGYFAVLTWS